MKYSVLTPTGWSGFNGVRRLKSDEIFTIFTDNNQLDCTSDHMLKLKTGTFTTVKQLEEGDVLFGGEVVKKVIKIQNRQTQVYDLMDVELDNQYFTNNLVSHNCGNLFHRLWIQAQQGKNRFNTTKLPWYVHPWRDQAWRDNQTKTMGQKKAKRQYDCDFESSGDNVVKDQILQILKDSTITQPIQKMMSDMFWMWKYPEAQKDYIISCDVARGDGSDYSAFHVLCIQDNQQVGQFKGQIGTREYANFIVRIARMFNNAFVIVQNASIGWAVLQEIVNLEYKNLYYHKKDFKYIDPDLHSKQRQTKKTDKQRDILGFTTSSRTRPLIIQKMILILESNQFIIHSNRTLNELWTFAWINGKPQAMDKYNDDLIMSLAIGLWVRYTSYVVKIEGQRLAKQRLAAISSGLDRQKQNQKKLNTGFFSAGAMRSRNYYDTNIVTVGNQQIDVYREFIGVKE